MQKSVSQAFDIICIRRCETGWVNISHVSKLWLCMYKAREKFFFFPPATETITMLSLQIAAFQDELPQKKYHPVTGTGQDRGIEKARVHITCLSTNLPYETNDLI